MASVEPAASSRTALNNAPCLLFAYHEMGFACMEALLEIGAPIAALVTHQDDPGEQVWWRSCTDLARRHSIAVFTPEGIDAQWIGRLRALRPEVIYSFYYRRLLPEAVLALAPMGAYNVHGSMLPRYRGRAPVNWVLVNGERETGVTLHHMVSRADAGDIVAQRAIAIDDSDTALSLYRKLVPLGAALIREYHPLIVAGRAPRRRQDPACSSYYGRRRPEDGRIDWRWPARRVFDLVRAVTHPYPGAFCFAGGRKLFVWEARVAAESQARGLPGVVLGEAAGGGLEVAAGEGSVAITRAALEDGAEGDALGIIGAAPGGRPRALV